MRVGNLQYVPVHPWGAKHAKALVFSPQMRVPMRPIELRARTASFKWQVSPLLLYSLPWHRARTEPSRKVSLAGQHSSVAVARNVLHLEAVPLTERSTSQLLPFPSPRTVLRCHLPSGKVAARIPADNNQRSGNLRHF